MTKDAERVLDEAQTTHEQVSEYLRDAADYFHEHEGEMFTRREARENLSDELDVSDTKAAKVLSQLVSDKVDPIVQTEAGGERYVGVAEFNEFEGAYGYLEYDDVIGSRRRVVCQKCVDEADFDKEVTHATEQSQSPESSTYKQDADYDDLLGKVHQHYEDAHDVTPDEIETGASLASGTTINSNTSWHDGNVSGGSNISIGATSVDVSPQGSGSGLNADTVDGTEASNLGVPSNAIAIWSGSISNIPSGWVICDGNNGTPNLQDRFVVGAGSTYSVDGTGGSKTHTLSTSELSAHDHSLYRGGGDSSGETVFNTNGLQIFDQDISPLDGSGGVLKRGGNSAHENRPPYYALAYIMKV